MWLYVADGSGVSVNVGRTLVFTSFKLARNFLIQLFPGSRYGPCPGTARNPEPHLSERARRRNAGGRRAMENASLGRVDPAAGAGTEGVVMAYLRLGSWERTPVNVSALDSVQILDHKEYFSGETRHEIVLLRHAECSHLEPQHRPSLGHEDVMCGRYPNLFPCSPIASSSFEAETLAETMAAAAPPPRHIGELSAHRRSATVRGADGQLVSASGHLSRLASCATVRHAPFSRGVSRVLEPAAGRCTSRCFDNGTLDASGKRLYMCPT